MADRSYEMPGTTEILVDIDKVRDELQVVADRLLAADPDEDYDYDLM